MFFEIVILEGDDDKNVSRFWVCVIYTLTTAWYTYYMRMLCYLMTVFMRVWAFSFCWFFYFLNLELEIFHFDVNCVSGMMRWTGCGCDYKVNLNAWLYIYIQLGISMTDPFTPIEYEPHIFPVPFRILLGSLILFLGFNFWIWI